MHERRSAGRLGSMTDQTNGEVHDSPRIVVVGSDGVATETDMQESRERPVTEMIEQPAKVMRVGNMIRQLLEEVRAAPLDEKKPSSAQGDPRELHQGT